MPEKKPEENKNEEKKENGGKTFVVGSLLAFLFSNVMLLIYGLFKGLRKKSRRR